MTKDEALATADRILKLVNSQPKTPTRDQIAAVLESTWHSELLSGRGLVIIDEEADVCQCVQCREARTGHVPMSQYKKLVAAIEAEGYEVWHEVKDGAVSLRERQTTEPWCGACGQPKAKCDDKCTLFAGRVLAIMDDVLPFYGCRCPDCEAARKRPDAPQDPRPPLR